MATIRHRSLIERGVRKAFDEDTDLAHTKKKCQENPDIHESEEKDSSTKSFQQSY